MNASANPDHARVLRLLKRYGREATSFQVLEPGLSYWFDGDEACVAYVQVRGAWVTAGEPVCAEQRIPLTVERFHEEATRNGARVRFFHVSEAFCLRSELAASHVGEEPVWDPAEWEAALSGSRSLREQLRRARAKGVSVRVVEPEAMGDPAHPVRRACEALVGRWLRARGMHEMRFMVLVHPFSFARERRYVIAEREGQLVGFAAAVPIYQRSGWFIEDLLRDPAAPNGTVELLVDAMMREFHAEGCRFATLGLAPLAGDVGPLLAFTRDYTTRLYNFPGVRAFKEKLKPRDWVPVYLAFPQGERGMRAMGDVLAAFAPSGVLRFALHTLVHQRTLVTRLLALLLVPWTLGLALADTARWFPSATVQWAWVVFDSLLVLLLLSLARRWRNGLAVSITFLTTGDALLTMLQALSWNVWTARGLVQWLFLALGCTGPLLAAAFFWQTRRVTLSRRVAAPTTRHDGSRALPQKPDMRGGRA